MTDRTHAMNGEILKAYNIMVWNDQENRRTNKIKLDIKEEGLILGPGIVWLRVLNSGRFCEHGNELRAHHKGYRVPLPAPGNVNNLRRNIL
jgi:hypothetical protein